MALTFARMASATASRLGSTQSLVRSFGIGVSARGVHARQVSGDEPNSTKVVIFDKDGTLICFHSMWGPWVEKQTTMYEDATGLPLADDLAKAFGYCRKQRRIENDNSLLAHATMPQVKDSITEVLTARGIAAQKASAIIDECWEDCDTSSEKTLVPLVDIHGALTSLRAAGIKTAVCTADTRTGTVGALTRLGVEHLVDAVVCGDDANTKPKPHSHNAFKICEELDIDPRNAMMVGDTTADVGMGRSAGLGRTVGVLSGIGSSEDLDAADYLVKDVDDAVRIAINSTRAGPAAHARTHLTAGARGVHTHGLARRSFSTTRTVAAEGRDYVIVGAGSAGCVLANRLSADPANTVTLLEAGPKDTGN